MGAATVRAENELERAMRRVDLAARAGVVRSAVTRSGHAASSEFEAVAGPGIDTDRAVAVNRQYRQSLGWAQYVARIAAVIGVPVGASEHQFAHAVARWQGGRGLAIDGIIGPITWAEIRSQITAEPAIDIGRAIALNRQYRQSLGWQAYASAIARLFGFGPTIPDQAAFAVAAARWQRGRGSLLVDGIIGPQTLRPLLAALESVTAFGDEEPSTSASAQEITPEPRVLRELAREADVSSSPEADLFVTEQVAGFPRGHQLLVSRSAAGIPTIGAADLTAMRNGVARVDDIGKSFDASEQRRHTLRRFVCQTQTEALREARNHLIFLHDTILLATSRTTRFEFVGEALHLIQDAYSPAHTERTFGGVGGFHPITFIRFFGFDGSLPFPREHRVFPPPDPRDVIFVGGRLTAFAAESVTASREFLFMILRHIPTGPSTAASADLTAFMDRHLFLSATHTPTRTFYPRRCP